MGLSDLCYRFFCCGGQSLRETLSSARTLLTIVYSAARSRDSIYDPVLADSEREAVADLLGFLENVPLPAPASVHDSPAILTLLRSEPKPTSSPASPSAH
jgi:hypothetical protein